MPCSLASFDKTGYGGSGLCKCPPMWVGAVKADDAGSWALSLNAVLSDSVNVPVFVKGYGGSIGLCIAQAIITHWLSGGVSVARLMRCACQYFLRHGGLCVCRFVNFARRLHPVCRCLLLRCHHRGCDHGTATQSHPHAKTHKSPPRV